MRDQYGKSDLDLAAGIPLITAGDPMRDINDVQYYPGSGNTPEATTGEAEAFALLNAVVPGFDPTDPHSAETAGRFARMLKELTTAEPFKFTVFPAESQNMVVLGPIPFYTLCAHHVVPFHGQTWIGYVPNKVVGGLSKFARAVKYYAKGLWVQENLTEEIADYLVERLDPLGVAVLQRAEHLCMAMRGVETPGVVTTTATMRGVFADHDKTAKAEFMEWVHRA